MRKIFKIPSKNIFRRKKNNVFVHDMKACARLGGGGQVYSSTLSLTSTLQGRKILDIRSAGRLGGLQSRSGGSGEKNALPLPTRIADRSTGNLITMNVSTLRINRISEI